MTTKSVFEAALKLPKRDRLRLAAQLRASAEDEDILQAAAKEAERRVEAYDRGEISGKPADEVIRRLLSGGPKRG
jgi:hypothetical protein